MQSPYSGEHDGFGHLTEGRPRRLEQRRGFEVSEDFGVLSKSQNLQGPERCVFMLRVGKNIGEIKEWR